jgi:hypothetical protein
MSEIARTCAFNIPHCDYSGDYDDLRRASTTQAM